MDNISYSFVKENNSNIIFRSKVNSFNLDHVTDKDITSFYASFSDYAYFDTGLLPLDGTGLIGIRKAGNHTQVTYQYKPGMYHVNWGAHEGDREYRKYYLAQPYRIVIIDFVDNNLLGARTFYSTEPAYNTSLQLYHVNLPNINCRGYQGNGVGWICLYHNQDLSGLPFNERLIKALERCSGVEVYNDANMSETDGPRIYREMDYPSYTYTPSEWEKKSEAEGFEWTLNPECWIPIKVKERDDQTKHLDDGQPLLLIDAIFGKYNAYYNDSYHPKPINSITRKELNLEPKQVSDWFVKAYNNAQTTFTGIDPYLTSSLIREEISIQIPSLLFDDDDDDDDDQESESIYCPFMDEYVGIDECSDQDHSNSYYSYGTKTVVEVCSGCVKQPGLVFAKNTECYYDSEDSKLILYYDPPSGEWWDTSAIIYPFAICPSCSSLHVSIVSDAAIYNIWHSVDNYVCSKCLVKQKIPNSVCCGCHTSVPGISSNINIDDMSYDEKGAYCSQCTYLLSQMVASSEMKLDSSEILTLNLDTAKAMLFIAPALQHNGGIDVGEVK